MSFRRALALTAVALAAIAGGCGDDGGDAAPQRACSTPLPSSQDWRGEPRSGRAAVDRFNEFLAGAEPPISTSPCDAARVFVHLDQRQQQEGVNFQVRTEPGDSPDAEVEITLANLPDDSLLAERWSLRFESAGGDRIRLAEARRAQSCRPGRGHTAFSPKPCR